MPFCPECRKEFEDGVVLCRDCRCDLVEALPPDSEGRFSAVREVPDAVTAAMWVGALESQGLHPELHSRDLAGYGGAVMRDWGEHAWGVIVVPREEHDEAVAVLEDFLSTAESKGLAEDEDPA